MHNINVNWILDESAAIWGYLTSFYVETLIALPCKRTSDLKTSNGPLYNQMALIDVPKIPTQLNFCKKKNIRDDSCLHILQKNCRFDNNSPMSAWMSTSVLMCWARMWVIVVTARSASLNKILQQRLSQISGISFPIRMDNKSFSNKVDGKGITY